MIALPSLAALVLLTAPSALAIPAQHVHIYTKRSSSSSAVGTGFTIAISMILLAGMFFYLGMRRERAQSWRLWRAAPYTHNSPNGPYTPRSPREHSLKSSISCPLAVSSSAPVHPVPHPVEAADPTVTYLELPCKEVYEMGMPSPRRPLRATWLSLDRRPWWISFSERSERASVRENSTARTSFVRQSSARTVGTNGGRMQVGTTPPPAYPEAVYSCVALEGEADGVERKSNGSSFMDWTGLEYVRRIYLGRKLSCMA
jgi:hypothetical protein